MTSIRTTAWCPTCRALVPATPTTVENASGEVDIEDFSLSYGHEPE